MMLSSLPRIRNSAAAAASAAAVPRSSSTLCKSISASLLSSSSPVSRPSPSPPTSWRNQHSVDYYSSNSEGDRRYTNHARNHRSSLSYDDANNTDFPFRSVGDVGTSSRYFSSSSSSSSPSPSSTDAEPEKKKKDLRESIERMKGNGSGADGDFNANASSSSSSSSSNEGGSPNPHLEKLASFGASFVAALSQTWEELVASGRAKSINKKIGTPAPPSGDDERPNYADDDEAADKYETYKGSKDVMVIDPQEHLSAWERMERRLRDAPIIHDILEKTHHVYEKSGAKEKVQRTSQKIQHLKEDAEEAWETSQNPWVYHASSVYDTLTAESEFAAASRALRVLDPDFAMETWKRDVVEHTLPGIMKLFLEGRITELKPWLGEAVYNRLAAEVRARKKEGVQMDTNVLAIMNAEILACEVEGASANVERGADPIILLHFMCQQIHCVRKKKGVETYDGGSDDDGGGCEGKKKKKEEEEEQHGRTYAEEELGEIVEGSEDDIRANSYVVAFQREYDEEKMELNWKIVDFRFNGAIAYL